MTDYTAYDEGKPCQNRSCPSYGTPHPNCGCYASGGLVHEFHLAHGGMLNFISEPKSMANADSHHDSMNELKGHLLKKDHESAVGLLHNHPVGLGNKAALEPIVRNLSDSIVNSPSNPDSLKAMIGYLNTAHRGVDKIKEHAANIFEKQPKRKMDHEKLGALKKELEKFQQNPGEILNVGEKLGHYLPDHRSEIAAQMSTAIGYLNSIKPASSQGGPMDPVMKPSVMQEYKYNRALEVAEDPTAVIHFAKDGTLNPDDLVTLHTIYPKVAQSIMSEATNAMIEKKTLTLKEKRTVSALLGQPLLYSQTPQSCQAIMQANASEPSPAPQGPGKKKSSGKATAAELKQIDDVNKLYATPLQERQINHKN